MKLSNAMLQHADHARAQSPLSGVILCCTSIDPERRGELAKWATEMGAAHKYDLTSDVTHLIVGNVDTPKYKYVAKERPDVKVVTPQWVEAVRESWLEGGDTDVAALEEQHRVPTFFGLRICITGFDDLEQRQYLQDTVTKNGGRYSGDLTKTVTHLIACAPQGKKYDHARMWHIKTVSLEWLTESLERRMALDETLYDPLLPQEERGRGAWKKLPSEKTPLGKRMRPPEKAGDGGESRRKLRRTASTKLGSHSSAIWNDIASGGSFSAQSQGDDSWLDNKLNEPLSDRGVPPQKRTALKKSASMVELNAQNAPIGGSIKHSAGFFGGRVMYTYGFTRVQSDILGEYLPLNGAQFAVTPEQLNQFSDMDLDLGFIILPHNITEDQMKEIPACARKLTQVNEWWVEKCLHRKQLLDPAKEILCRPLPRLKTPILEGMVVTFSGFVDFDRLHVSKVLKIMGATYDESLRDTTALLICHSSPNQAKIKYCAERSIPVVSAAWLWDCIESAIRKPFDEYLLMPAVERSMESSMQIQPRADPVQHESALTRLGRSDEKPSVTLAPRNPNVGQDRPQGFARHDAYARRSGPFYESGSEDDGADTGLVGAECTDGPPPYESVVQRSLHELSPSEANLPRKSSPTLSRPDVADARKAPQPAQHSHANNAKSMTKSTSTIDETPSNDNIANANALTNTIAALLAQKKQQQHTTNQRPASAHSASGSVSSRRRRQLGRAPSMTSNASAASSVQADTGNGVAGSHAEEGGEDIGGVGDGGEAIRRGWQAAAPSQALVWGDGADDGEGESRLKAVEKIGVVKDVGEDDGDGVGSRVGRRRAGRI